MSVQSLSSAPNSLAPPIPVSGYMSDIVTGVTCIVVLLPHDRSTNQTTEHSIPADDGLERSCAAETCRAPTILPNSVSVRGSGRETTLEVFVSEIFTCCKLFKLGPSTEEGSPWMEKKKSVRQTARGVIIFSKKF